MKTVYEVFVKEYDSIRPITSYNVQPKREFQTEQQAEEFVQKRLDDINWFSSQFVILKVYRSE